MPDVPYPKETEEKADEFKQALWGFGGAVGAVTRTAITGERAGRVRRPILFLIVGIGLWGAADWWLFSLVGLIALLILALTDQVVDLSSGEVPE